MTYRSRMATRIDLSEFNFMPIVALDQRGARLAVAELPRVMLFDAVTGTKIDEYPWVEGDPASDEKPGVLSRDEDEDEDEDDEDEDDDEDYESDLSERLGIPTDIAFSPDGRHFVVCCSHHSGSQGSNDCYLFDVTRPGSPLRFLGIDKAMRAHNASSASFGYNDPDAVLFTPDGAEVVIAGAFGVFFFSVFDAGRVRWLKIPPTKNKMGSAYSVRETTALAVRGDRGALVWCDSLWLFDLRALSSARRVESPGEIQLGSQVRFADDDTVVVASSAYDPASRESVERVLYTVDLRENQWTARELPAALCWLATDASSALVSSDGGRTLLRVDVRSGDAVTIPRAKKSRDVASRLLAVSEDGATLARANGGRFLGEDCSEVSITRRVRKE